jgi:Flp pilus assembly protein TadG
MAALKKLLRNSRAASTMEFALVAPIFVVLLIGIAQLGLVFFANAGLHNALAQGARRATLFPRPTEAQVKSSVNAAKFGLNPAGLSQPVVDYYTTASPSYADVQMSYTTSLNFIVFKKSVTLTQRRRVYLQPLPEA